MQQVQLNFSAVIGSKRSRLPSRCLRADHDLAVLKREHIGSTANAAEFFMQRGHSRVADNHNFNVTAKCNLRLCAPGSPDELAGGAGEGL